MAYNANDGTPEAVCPFDEHSQPLVLGQMTDPLGSTTALHDIEQSDTPLSCRTA